MKIGVTMDLHHTYNLWGEDCYKKVKEFGVSCVDFQSMAPDDSFVYTKTQKEAEAILLKDKKLAEDAGIEISQVHGPWRFPPRDDTAKKRAERLEVMKKSIWGTAVLGCKNWIVHAIMPFGIEDADTPNAEETFKLNIEFMSEILKEAKKYDITICLENLPFTEFSLSKPADILRFVNTINDDNFKICLDTGHVEAFSEINIGDAVREMGSKLQTFHIHDSKYGKDLHMFPYFGVINWDEFAKALGDIGYSGVFSLETLPPYKLPVSIYEEMCSSLVKIAEHIISKI